MYARANPQVVTDLSRVIGSEVSSLDLIGLVFFGGSGLAAYSFMIFNLLCAPCVATIGAISQEMNSSKWTFAAIGYMTGFAYAISLIVYQLGLFLSEGHFTVWTAIALVVLIGLLYLLFRKNKYTNHNPNLESSANSICQSVRSGNEE
jgi:ferrous iron transport protein B